MTVLDSDNLFVGRIDRLPEEALDDRVIKIVFLLPEDRVFNMAEWRQEIDDAFDQIRAREALVQDYYKGVAFIMASQEALGRLPILLAPGQRYWVLGAKEFFSLQPASAGNWSDSELVLAAKSALGAQIYRLDALMIGASTHSISSTGGRRAIIQQICAARLRPRLEGLLRATGSRGEGGDWQTYVEELRQEFGAPFLRRLYGESENVAARLAVGTRWRREGRALAEGIGDLDTIEITNPCLRRDFQLLDLAADFLARTAILERDGIASAVRAELLDEDNMAAIVDINGLPDLGLATEAARFWNINPSDYFYSLGAMRGHFDAARALGTYGRTGRVELAGLASHGIAAIMREQGDTFFDAAFVQLRQTLRQAMPEVLVEGAEAAVQ